VAIIFFNADNKDITFLKVQWDKLASVYTSDETIKEEISQVLKEKYSEEHRFYHNLSHVKALLTLFESLKGKIQDHSAIRFSIWFHDVIYDTQRNDNEEESARLASEMLGKIHVNAETIEIVRDLILATKDHSGRNLSRDAKLFLDMDLAILGASKEIYKEYSQAIREEYSWVSESAYRKGRNKVLQSFIERERIYFTNEMQIRFEKQARININDEITLVNARKQIRV
jgi:predicted metal-dependent HD superfamily phosphohydrolase